MNGDNSAEFGHSTGAVINAITYTGTNQFHGHVWEYFQNEDLNANDYFNKLESRGKVELRHNEFGGLLGGPVLLPHYNGRNRTFFFFDFQRTMHANPNSYTQTVPTATMQNSGFTNMQDLFYAEHQYPLRRAGPQVPVRYCLRSGHHAGDPGERRRSGDRACRQGGILCSRSRSTTARRRRAQ